MQGSRGAVIMGELGERTNGKILESGLRLLLSARADEKYSGTELSDWEL